MSKAFVKESEAGRGEDALLSDFDALPRGVKNYVTPNGARKLQEESRRLNQETIPQLKLLIGKTSDGAGHWEAEKVSSAKRDLQVAEHRLHFLERRLASMEVINGKQQVQDRVYFGASVGLLENGILKNYAIVGVDEADPSIGKISWISPLAVALRAARIGDKRMVDLPGGLLRLEIKTIDYIDEN